MSLARNKTRKDGILSSSATSTSLCKGSLNFSVARYYPKVCFLHAATKWSIIALWSCLPIKWSRECILQNFRTVWKRKCFYIGTIIVRKVQLANSLYVYAHACYSCIWGLLRLAPSYYIIKHKQLYKIDKWSGDGSTKRIQTKLVGIRYALHPYCFWMKCHYLKAVEM